jgi:hypothetical protein
VASSSPQGLPLAADRNHEASPSLLYLSIRRIKVENSKYAPPFWNVVRKEFKFGRSSSIFSLIFEKYNQNDYKGMMHQCKKYDVGAR